MFIYIGNFLLRSVARLKTESLYQSLASMKKEMYTEKYIATWICIIHVLLPRQVPCSIEPATVSAGPLKHCINAIFNCLVGQQPHLLYAARSFWSTLLLQISNYPSCYSEDSSICIMCCLSFTKVTCNHIPLHVPQYKYTVNVLHLRKYSS